MVWAQPLSSVAPRFGLTANGLAKLCDRLDIPRPPRSYWSKAAEQRPAPTPLPDDPRHGDGARQPAAATLQSHRKRTRLSPVKRQEQLLDAAAAIALREGVQQVTLKRVAREAGISEAQAHNCFQGRTDLLLSLTRREIAIVEQRRRSRVERGRDRIASIVMSTISYLHEAQERGPLLQMLMRNTDVRAALREERAAATALAREPSLRVLAKRYAMRREIANGSAAALTAVTLRAGGLLASGRTDLGVAERLCLAIVLAGARSNEEWAQEPR
jgi:AcrR family transcriptional regulator